jgi:hypothetical protein
MESSIVVRTFPSDDREFRAFVADALAALTRSGFTPDRVPVALGLLVRAEYPDARVSDTILRSEAHEYQRSTVDVFRGMPGRPRT